jgi:hypothetical protein
VATKQLMAVFGFLAFVGTFLTLAATVGAIVIVKLIGEERVARWTDATSVWLFGGRGLARKLVLAALVLLGGYTTVLLAASAASREWSLAPGAEKYFCEIDCHLAYSVAGVQKRKTIGSGASQTTAGGRSTSLMCGRVSTNTPSRSTAATGRSNLRLAK